MKKYIKEHWKPILIGYVMGITVMNTYQLIDSVVIKIALIILK